MELRTDDDGTRSEVGKTRVCIEDKITVAGADLSGCSFVSKWGVSPWLHTLKRWKIGSTSGRVFGVLKTMIK